MAYPTLISETVTEMIDGGTARQFPFLWWASGSHFRYPATAKHLFCRAGSAAEAFFLRPFVEREGCEFSERAAICCGVIVTPQHRVGKYRVDFGVRAGGLHLAIEVDGLAFHHRDASQIEEDYLRARRVTAAGFTVVRFTAREAFRDAEECWRQVDHIITASARRGD